MDSNNLDVPDLDEPKSTSTELIPDRTSGLFFECFWLNLSWCVCVFPVSHGTEGRVVHGVRESFGQWLRTDGLLLLVVVVVFGVGFVRAGRCNWLWHGVDG